MKAETIPAKWVLTGEHSVLRGKQAILFPYPQFSLTLTEDTVPDARLDPLFERARLFLNKDQSGIKNQYKVKSTIPMGAGLGSSAALSVAVSKMIFSQLKIQDSSILLSLATYLEQEFHGISSGMDILAVIAEEPVLYSPALKPGSGHQFLKPLSFLNKFKFELIDTGIRKATTKECIQNVIDSGRFDLDEKMQAATEWVLQSEHAPEKLVEGMNLAQSCFETWGLITPEMMQQKEKLLQSGALAVKLTGAGLGGYWIVLRK